MLVTFQPQAPYSISPIPPKITVEPLNSAGRRIVRLTVGETSVELSADELFFAVKQARICCDVMTSPKQPGTFDPDNVD